MSREGSLDAPMRHPLEWQSEEFYDFDAIEKEMERVFDICHGCRRCFNLCESFPKLFDMVDESPTMELDGVPKEKFAEVVDACTLCDMCFMTKCPYVPPHEFNLDFPHLMLRHRAATLKKKSLSFGEAQLTQMDRNGNLAKPVAGIANWASDRSNTLTRGIMASMLGVDEQAELPKFQSRTLMDRAKATPANRAADGPAKQRKAVLFATCYTNFNQPRTGEAARAVLGKLGVDVEVAYPGCCGMPQLEHGDLAAVAKSAEKVSAEFIKWIDKGYDVVALTASCGLMLKFEWPLILPQSDAVKRLSKATFDIDEYVVDIAKKEGLAPGLKPLEGGVTVHLACHARAQNMGPKAAELLRYLPDTKVDVVERCSGHGGTFGIMKKTRAFAQKVAKPVVKAVEKNANGAVCSECPLACKHITQELADKGAAAPPPKHPIEIFAEAYGLI
ncbi:MAG: heterodisulfide reductase-related iron-sulfur binding cluster [Caulobacterales bacterium]